MCKDAAERLLDSCLKGERWSEALLSQLLSDECSPDLFQIVAEGLSDRFEPNLCYTYANLFTQIFAMVEEGLSSRSLMTRYRRIRQPRRFEGLPPERVFVLSRVTLGADVAITSVMLDAAKKRFPGSEIVFVGGRKSLELFSADPRITQHVVDYPRGGSLRDRLGPWKELRTLLSAPRAITIDPDSRMSQLGLLPICPDEQYYFFESRSFGGAGSSTLQSLARQWANEALGIDDSAAYLSPQTAAIPPERPFATVSFGVGENLAKRIGGDFEVRLLRSLIEHNYFVLVDKGAGGEEARRVEKAIAGAGCAERIRTWNGAFAPFASMIMQSDLYVGYDSAGQHVAAAAGVPLITIFAGFPSERMRQRWTPTGPGRIEVIPVYDPSPSTSFDLVNSALDRLAIS